MLFMPCRGNTPLECRSMIQSKDAPQCRTMRTIASPQRVQSYAPFLMISVKESCSVVESRGRIAFCLSLSANCSGLPNQLKPRKEDAYPKEPSLLKHHTLQRKNRRWRGGSKLSKESVMNLIESAYRSFLQRATIKWRCEPFCLS